MASQFRVGPTASSAGVFNGDWVISTAVKELISRGGQPKMFVSASLDQGDDHDRELMNFLRQWIRGRRLAASTSIKEQQESS
jgi:uncharacterized phosphosugar-binding protein